MPLTILSTDGLRRAVVSETDDGVAVAFFRLIYSGRYGDGPSDLLTDWRYVRTSVIPQPFHVALDIAHAIVQGGC